MPALRPVRSKVVPAGTTKLDRTMLEHDFFPLATEAAPLAPEKVHVARLSTAEASLTCGSEAAIGLARAGAMPQAASRRAEESIVVLKAV